VKLVTIEFDGKRQHAASVSFDDKVYFEFANVRRDARLGLKLDLVSLLDLLIMPLHDEKLLNG